MGFTLRLYEPSVTPEAAAAFAAGLSEKAYEIFSKTASGNGDALSNPLSVLREATALENDVDSSLLKAELNRVSDIAKSFSSFDNVDNEAAHKSVYVVMHALMSAMYAKDDQVKEAAQHAAAASFYLEDAARFADVTVNQQNLLSDVLEQYRPVEESPRFRI